MEKEEAYKLYGSVLLRFDRYYKYKFTFKGVAADGAIVEACIGGDAPDIYRFELNVSDGIFLSELRHTYADIELDGIEIYSEELDG